MKILLFTLLGLICFTGAALSGYDFADVRLLAAEMQEAALQREQQAEREAAAARKREEELAAQPPRIEINVASRKLDLYQGGKKTHTYLIATGTPWTPTPTGEFQIMEKTLNPDWTNPRNRTIVIPSGPSNPLGYRWLGFAPNYGIHGTNQPGSIGRYASNGCVRMHEEDVEELFTLVSEGNPVIIIYERVVLEQAGEEGIVNCRIYPDDYGWQPIDTQYVRQRFAALGLEALASDEILARQISNSNGQPWSIATVPLKGQP